MSRIVDLYRMLSDLGEIDPLSEAEQEAVECLEREGLIENPEELLTYLKIPKASSADWLRDVVTPKQFMEDTYFAGPAANSLFPKLRTDFINIFSGSYHEITLTGSIGWGKTFFMAWGMFRQLYELSCLKNPQRFLGGGTGQIAPNTPIVMVNLSVTGQQAKNACFLYVQNLVDNSPYFQEHFRRDENYNSALRFPNTILYQPGTSSEFSAIGTNVISGAIDEANFLVSTKRLAHEKLQGEVDRALVLYRALSRRIESRFKFSKGWKGRLFIGSSKVYEGDFIDERLKNIKGQPGHYVMDYSHWDVRDPSHYTGKTFKVVVGSAAESSRIVTEDDRISEDTRTIDIPEEYRQSFETDLEGAIRDIAGQSLYTSNPWFTNRRAISNQIADKYMGFPLTHPFKMKDTSLCMYSDSVELDPEVLCNRHTLIEDGKKIARWVPKRMPEQPRFIHIDLALNNDAVGMAMGFTPGSKEIERQVPGTQEVEVQTVPIVVIELVASIAAPLGGEINMAGVREIVYQLRRDLNFYIGSITFDTYQSVDSQQILTAANFQVDELSVDRDNVAYSIFRSGVSEGWIYYYDHKTLLREMQKLQRHLSPTKRMKVDHPEKDPENKRTGRGSKDTTDAVAAVIRKIVEETTSGGVMLPPTVRMDARQFLPDVDDSPWNLPENEWIINRKR